VAAREKMLRCQQRTLFWKKCVLISWDESFYNKPDILLVASKLTERLYKEFPEKANVQTSQSNLRQDNKKKAMQN
jgi:hypothetical protein